MKILWKDSIKEIKNTFRRFLSILLIVLLGVGFFAGIKATSPDMKNTLDQYLDDKNVFDIEIISTLGLTQNDIEEIQKVDGVGEIEGGYSKDILINLDEKESVVKVLSIPDKLNQLQLIEGNLPQNEGECVVEETVLNSSSKKIGDDISFIMEEGDAQFLKNSTMTIVGTVRSPLYISRERGSTKLASGKINYYVYVPKKVIQSEVYTEVYVSVKDTIDLNYFSNKYERKINEVCNKIEQIAQKQQEKRYEEIKNVAEQEVKNAEEELQRKQAEASIRIEQAKKQIQEGKNEAEKNEQKILNSETNLQINQEKLKKELEKGKKEIEKAEQTILNQQKEYENGKDEWEQKKQEASNGLVLLNLQKSEIHRKIQELNQKKIQLEQLGQDTSQIEKQIKILENQNVELNKQIQSVQEEVVRGEQQLISRENNLNEAKKVIEDKKQQLKQGQNVANSQLKQAKQKIAEGKKQLESAKKQIKESEEQLEKQQKELNKQIEEAQIKINKVKEEIKKIARPNWYLLDRDKNVGFASFSQDTERIANIGKVFPIVFFIVAALISLTSMTRMVEEQRTEIGTLKAMGYTKMQIIQKYIIYALLATIVGSLVGMIIGFNLLPKVIFSMYGMMYSVPDVTIEFNIQYAIIGMGCALLCTVGATVLSCVKELKSSPAVLMRPKAPKMGKRVLLEKVTWIWSKLKFTQKVTVRNIFRYKKRFLMTIIGITGCTALIVAGFGLRDSVGRMIPSQYGEIFQYDLLISLKEEDEIEKKEDFIQKLKEEKEIKEIVQINQQSIDIMEKGNQNDIQLIVPKDTRELQSFIQLKNSKTKKQENLDDTGIILTEKIAKILNIKVGDTIKVKNSEDIEVEVKVSGIVCNYLMHYAYMSPNLYQKLYQEEMSYNTIFTKNEVLTKESEENLGSRILENNQVSSISFISRNKSMFDEIMDNMSFVVWILIIAAGLLDFVVLYNLSNINISERIRELATIKVLGFYDKEVYQYIGRETIILTVIGIGIGLFMGYFLNLFIIKTCELDILMFDPRVHATTYIYATILTIIFTIIVNIVTYFSLKKIDMIESLKSVE